MAQGAENGVEELFALVRAQAEAIARLPPSEWDRMLEAVHARHEQSGVTAGMSREAALDMADRLDGWIRAALSLMAQHGRPPTMH